MPDKLLFLTGHLAEARLNGTLAEIGLPEDTFEVRNVGIKVAALMTEKILKNRLEAPLVADRVILPGRVRMDLQSLGDHFGVPFELGPEELIDLPQFLGRGGKPPDLSQYDINIFAEIVEAPELPLDELIARALKHKSAGADVIDLGCRPDVPFPGLEDAVKALKAEGLKVSVDSGDWEELRRAAQAGADFVLSLDEDHLEVVAGTKCVPVLIPREHGDIDSLVRAIEKAEALGIPHLADPILDPIHFGFMKSLERYADLRRRCPDVEMLMGTGNLTELTEADSQGLTAMLVGICSELNIRNVLIVQVSPHTTRTVEEHDAARRLMFRAREDNALPKGYGGGLLSLHDLRPFPQTPDEIAKAAAAIRDANFRIEPSTQGLHIYNRFGHNVEADPFELFGKLGVEEDGSHAFYLGYELAKAEIARTLGKRYTQDRPLDWGVAADAPNEDMIHHAPEGATLRAARELAEQKREEARKEAAEKLEAAKKDGGAASKPPPKA
ncbi:MAG: dihydropteroate synthase [Alphaproteobacteria bacterium]|nr:dihydropteroate synthase [Alphaproteobacteria bacterium]